MRVEFSDGIQEIPDHLAELLRGMETYKLTYKQAIEKANWSRANAYAEDAIRKIRADHLKRYG